MSRYKKGKTSAPMGGRVHWLLMFLPRDFNRAYRLRFDYEYHNCHFMRYVGRTVRDEFVVVRTSRDCFHVMYLNFETLFFASSIKGSLNEPSSFVHGLKISSFKKSICFSNKVDCAYFSFIALILN